jgi:hypothetical protein
MSATGEELWQSGESDIYAALLLRFPAIAPLLIPVMYSMVCMGAWLARPELVANFWVRFGIYSGAVVSSFFFGLTMATKGPHPSKVHYSLRRFVWMGKRHSSEFTSCHCVDVQ